MNDQDVDLIARRNFWQAYLFLVLAILALALCSCGLMSPAAQETAIQVLSQMRALGQITEEQYQALLQALLQAGSAHFWEQVVTAVGGAAMAYASVQVRRKIDHRQARATRQQVPLATGPVPGQASPGS